MTEVIEPLSFEELPSSLRISSFIPVLAGNVEHNRYPAALETLRSLKAEIIQYKASHTGDFSDIDRLISELDSDLQWGMEAAKTTLQRFLEALVKRGIPVR